MSSSAISPLADSLEASSCNTQDGKYPSAMATSTLTIRLPVEQREALKRSAESLKKTKSEWKPTRC